MFQPDEWQRKALLTWYKEGNPLHLDPRHPCIKLAGEAGEILDLYGKNEYKPGFSWWNCKHCREGIGLHTFTGFSDSPNCEGVPENYTPLILDELGDYSYYLRVLAYQKQVTFEILCDDFNPPFWNDIALEALLILLNEESAILLSRYALVNGLDNLSLRYLRDLCHVFLAILHKLEIPLEQVLELNYRKLNSEPTAHGWKNAR